MPKAMCPSCLTDCRVRSAQFGRTVICTDCHSKFAPTRPTERGLGCLGVVIVGLALAAVAVVVALAIR
jgi:hypothetical protein